MITSDRIQNINFFLALNFSKLKVKRFEKKTFIKHKDILQVTSSTYKSIYLRWVTLWLFWDNAGLQVKTGKSEWQT